MPTQQIYPVGQPVSFVDNPPTTGNLTAADAASSTASGAGGQSLVTGTPTTGSTVTASVRGAAVFTVQVTGTWVGTLQFERSVDDGTTWVPSGILVVGGTTVVSATTTATNGVWQGNAGGITTVRVRCTAYTNGTAAVQLQPGNGAGAVGFVSALLAGESHLGEVGGRCATPTANFTRPSDTTAYASGDLVANSTTAGSVTPLSWTVARVAAGSGMVRRCRLKKSTTSTTNASFRLHLYTASPTCANGDNGAWSTTHSGYLGSIDVTVDKAFSDAAAGNGQPNVGSEISFALASGQTIYGLLETRAAYSPGNSEVLTCELEVWQN